MMGKRMCRKYVFLKICFIVFLRVVCNCFLMSIGRSKLNMIISCPTEFKIKQDDLYKEFHKLFHGYNECSVCIHHCCHSQINRFDLIDCYLNRFALAKGLSPWHKMPHLILSVKELLQNENQFNHSDFQKENCVYHSMSSGCLLPEGSKPGMCISGACFKLIKCLDNENLNQYSRLLSRYIIYYLRYFFSLSKDLLKA